ncbi:hypothetical protein EJ04DRAFT_523495 [Polyplosphaeria fusca]|uniref:Uncharacterized protein n=1 Tax=Polyplosphaeria fusca TaxID=682080 RepID=A0A9P4QY90_9PLEO|nr:hypothetical protein EJ04DRAFT_523495 [Polyplosphaeria fusca]
MPPTRSSARKRAGTTSPLAKPAGKRQKPSRKAGRRKTKPNSSSSIRNEWAYLDKLPNELLLLILEQIGLEDCPCHECAHYEALYTYRSLARTNKHLSAVAMEFLYKSFRTRRQVPGGHVRPGKFLTTLIANPTLANNVHRVRWEVNETSRFPYLWDLLGDGQVYRPSGKDKNRLRSSLTRLGIPGVARRPWTDKYNRSTAVDELSVLLLHTPNIQKLHVVDLYPMAHIQARKDTRGTFLPLLMNAVNGQPLPGAPSFEKLSALHLAVGRCSLHNVRHLFALPGLRRLKLQYVQAYQPKFIPDPAMSSRVEELRLYDADVDSDSLCALINMCEKLKQLHFLYHPHIRPEDPEVMPEDPHPKLDYGKIGHALQKHKETLEVIDLDDKTERPFMSELDGHHLGAFNDFKKLTTLGAPFLTFEPTYKDDYGQVSRVDFITLLPATLERLNITVFPVETMFGDCYHSLLPFFNRDPKVFDSFTHIHFRVHKDIVLSELKLKNYGNKGWIWSRYRTRVTMEQSNEWFEDNDFDSEEFHSDSESDFESDFEFLSNFPSSFPWSDFDSEDDSDLESYGTLLDSDEN